MTFLLIFLHGVCILVGAIVFNVLAHKAGLRSWFDFLKNPHGTDAFSYAWLFVLYPFGLGLIAYISMYLI